MQPTILIVFYSMYGHIYRMAKAVAEGVQEAGGEPVLRQVAELVPDEAWSEEVVTTKEMMKEIPIANPRQDLEKIDGVIVGTPTRFGNMCAQMRNFWDQTGGAWAKGLLVTKPAAAFTSSNNQHGGQETTIISTHLTFLHHGCVIIGLPYSFKEQMVMNEITGGSPYGPSTVAGSGPPYQRMPTENDLKLARSLGKHLTEIARKLSS
ncbi:MAG: NAD(P)H:quinone oxidoreductase [Candidatus Bathyarchaeota archaeon]|nr:MAG: NAD(P)H:quinone oxidoreductase [Candidatus Bathyarchaeota archaeon]